METNTNPATGMMRKVGEEPCSRCDGEGTIQSERMIRPITCPICSGTKVQPIYERSTTTVTFDDPAIVLSLNDLQSR